MKHTFLPAIFTLALAFDVSAQHPGDLDGTFGVDGIVTTDFDYGDGEASSLEILLGGRIIVAGTNRRIDDDDFAVTRYLPDGNLDYDFGTDGIVLIDFNSEDDGANSIASQPDRKTIVAGSTGTYPYKDFALVRLNIDGSIDSSFGSNGKVVTDIYLTDFITSVAIQPDGKIVAAGFAAQSLDSLEDFALARYNPDGSLDATFSQDGIVKTDFSRNIDRIAKVVILNYGKILVAGASFNGLDYDFALARYNPDGSLDYLFGTGGKVTTAISAEDDEIGDMAIQPDGKIVVAGSTTAGGDTYFALARYNVDGSLDSSFGVDGRQIADVFADTSSINGASSIVIQPDGKIIAGGTSGSAPSGLQLYLHFALIRFTSNGQIDSSFGVDGKVLTYIGPREEISSMVMQPDGKIVAAGYTGNIFVQDDFALARYLSALNVGIVEFSQSPDNILIYPNPLTQTATLEYVLQQEETLSIRLLDMQGKTSRTFLENTKQEVGQHQQAIALPESLPAGSYLIVIESAKGRMGVKVVK